MPYKCETFRGCRTAIPLPFLKVSNQYTMPYGFYGCPNEQNLMCELYPYSQIGSHIRMPFGEPHNR